MSENMKYCSFLLILIILISSCQKKEFNKQFLIKNWEFREVGGEWSTASVPGSVYLDLYDNNIIEDPFYKDNESKVQWVDSISWEYKAIFNLDLNFLKAKNIILSFSGIDTYADVYLNDHLINSCDNFFVSYEINIAPYLKEDNELRFLFHPTTIVNNELAANHPYELPGGERVFSRKPQFHFGWDWGPKLVGCGITEDVIVETQDEALIKDFYVRTNAINDTALLSLEITVDYNKSKSYFIEFMGNIFPIDSGELSIDFAIHNPKLWFPRGYGEQFFYPLNIKLLTSDHDVVDEITSKYAIRTIKLIQEEENIGKGFKFQVNGIDFYAKGANYIPLDFFHTRVDSVIYEKALKNVIDANMNMLRVWGGGIYERDYFYDLCDSLGILVWQDFMFACAMYPGNKSFIKSVEIEANQQIKRLRKHPSIALWCGNNENSEGWHRWGWQNERTQSDIDSIWMDYKKLFQFLLPNLVESLSTTDYWESSPKYGRGNPKHQFYGDSHYWGVWHDAEPFKNFDTKVPRFMSEYGFQSFPKMDAIKLFATDNNLSINSNDLLAHQKHPRGNDLINEYILRDYNPPVDFESFVYLSQVIQAEGMKIGMEAHRRSRPYNMGTLYWQLNDCWPSVSWSSIDYYDNWKALHYAAKETYNDLIISSIEKNDSILIYAINDSPISTSLNLKISHVDYDGNTLDEINNDAYINASTSSLIHKISLNKYDNTNNLLNKSYLDIQLIDDSLDVSARKFHHFVPPKYMELPVSGISYKVEKDSLGFILELFSDGFIKNLEINCEHDGRFEDNYFDLPANEIKRIHFYNDYPMEDFNVNLLTFYSIVDTYY